MPLLNTDDMFTQPTGHFGFSAVRIEKLGATEYTLVDVAVDRSGSTDPFKTDLEKLLQTVVKGCMRCPRADNLLLRVVEFDTKANEIHGYMELKDVPLDKYVGALKRDGGRTSLNDTCVNSFQAQLAYADQLGKNDFSANGIFIGITDGCDNASTLPASRVKEVLAEARQKEKLESLVSILIGVNMANPTIAATLADFARDAGFDQFIDIGEVTESRLAKLAAFISKSVSSQSQALGSGGPSQPVQLVF